MGTASATQIDCAHDVSLLLGAADTEVGREASLAPRRDTPGTRSCDPEGPTSQSSLPRTTQNDSMNVGRVAPIKR